MSMYTLVPFGQSVLRRDHVLLPARFRTFGALVIGIAYRGRKEGLFLPVPFGQSVRPFGSHLRGIGSPQISVFRSRRPRPAVSLQNRSGKRVDFGKVSETAHRSRPSADLVGSGPRGPDKRESSKNIQSPSLSVTGAGLTVESTGQSQYKK